jgi:hypothetical protein
VRDGAGEGEAEAERELVTQPESEAPDETASDEEEPEAAGGDDEGEPVDLNEVLRTLRDEPEVREFLFSATELGDVTAFEYDEVERTVELALDLNGGEG